MLDLTTIPPETITARGQYSSYNAAWKEEKKRLSILGGEFSSIASQVLRMMQPANDTAPDLAGAVALISAGRKVLDKMEECVVSIDGLWLQRTALKDAAWGRP
jgi:hypothetical protein